MFRLRLYQRYLMRETFAAIFLVLAAFLALFSFFNLVNELPNVGKSGYQFSHAVGFVALGLPGLVYELIPIAALIGTLYALSTLARHSEITVLRASGLATRDLLLTLFRVAGLLALLTLLVGEVLAPVSERLAQELRALKARFVAGTMTADQLREALARWLFDHISRADTAALRTQAR